ncbi:hypothetical protein Tco_1577507 [Tanacetum coccineum]
MHVDVIWIAAPAFSKAAAQIIVSSKGPSKALLKWYKDATDEDAMVEDTTDEELKKSCFQSLKVKRYKGRIIQLQQSSSKALFQLRDACLD